jgi:hypothetical protein
MDVKEWLEENRKTSKRLIDQMSDILPPPLYGEIPSHPILDSLEEQLLKIENELKNKRS